MEFLKSLDQHVLYILAFCLAFIISLLVTPLSRKFAYFVGAIDKPKDRSMHTKPMPLAGGTAIVAGFTGAVIIFVPLLGNFDLQQFVGLLGGGFIIMVVGLLDDIYDLKPHVKFFFQVLAALIVVYSGITIEFITWPWEIGGQIEFGHLSGIITVLWIVGITNAVNFLDGLDGLAAGISSIASLSLMFIALLNSAKIGLGPMPVLLTATLAGSCLGFLPHNFNPAKIFMGDTGSTFLGFALAVISIQSLLKSYTAVTLVIPVFILGLPIFDTAFAITRRLLTNKPFYEADRGHLHHRLVDKGISHRRAVIVLYFVSGGFGIAGVLLALNDIVISIGIIVLILFIWIVDMIYTNKKKNKEADINIPD